MNAAKKDKKEKEEVEIIINFLNKPSEQAIYNLNKEWLKILREMERDGTGKPNNYNR